MPGQPQQRSQQQADERRVGRIKIDLRTRPAGHPQGPAVEQVHQRFRPECRDPVQRLQRRDQPGECCRQPQQEDRFDQPEHGHAGDQRIQAGDQAPQHQHRKGRHTGTAGDAERLPHRCPLLPQTVCKDSAAFAGGFFVAAAFFFPPLCTAAGQCGTRQRPQHRRIGKLKPDVADRVAVACGHQHTRYAEGGQRIRRAVDPDAQRADPHGCPGPEDGRREAGHSHQQHRHPGPKQSIPATAGIAA